MDKAQGFGLEGVNAADTRLSEVDGEAGRLIIAGASVEAPQTFAQVVHRLFTAAGLEVDEVGGRLGRARLAASERVSRLEPALAMADGEVLLGQYQSIILAEIDGPRDRRLQIQIVGE